jgi:uncharacterized protein (DUF362 family)
MNRRVFFKNLGLTAVAGSTLGLGKLETVLAGISTRSPGSPYDLVAVKGGEPDVMFDRGIEAFGGLNTFVKKGHTVVIKPNMGWDVPPERGGNTSPALIKRIIEHCYQSGASKVYVFDHTCDNWEKCYANSGIERSARDAGATVVPANSEGYYHEVSVPRGTSLTKAKEHELVLESDVFINVPILKNHGGSQLTMAMKNLMGSVWDRKEWHRNDLHQCIADFSTYRKPTLNVLDAYLVMKQNGPRGVSVDDVVLMKSQILSTDMLALDVAGSKLFGINPGEIRYLTIAGSKGVGRSDLENLNIKRIVL